MTFRKFFHISLIIIVIQSLIPAQVYSVDRKKFSYFTDIDGLPRNITTCIEQDLYGYVWIGTGNGLASYDGHTFTSYDQFKSIIINCLYTDTKNNLWVGANNGLYLYHRTTSHFELKVKGYVQEIHEDKGEIYFLLAKGIHKLSASGYSVIMLGNEFLNFCITKEGIWYSNKNRGAKLLSSESGLKNLSDSVLLGFNISEISSINGNLLLGCRNGQLFARKADGSIHKISIDNHHSFKEIAAIDNEIWLATDGNGVIVLDSNLNFSRTLNKNQGSEPTISSNSIYDIYQGSNHEIWIASYGAGLTCIVPDNALFTNIVPEKGNPNSLVASEGVAVFVQDGLYYFGTNYGLSVWNEQRDQYTNFSMNKLGKELKGVKVLGIITDKEKNLWIGTNDGLLGKFSSGHQFLKAFHPSSNNPEEMQQIVLMHNFNNTNLVIGTQYQDQCLLNFDLKSETVSTISMMSGPNKLSHFQINSIRENQNGELLALVSTLGLYHINLKDNLLENNLSQLNKQINFWINDFYHDKKGNYWMTTTTEGLVCISADGSEIKRWSIKEGFLSNTLIRVESVDDQFLWISSISGLSRFDMKSGEIINFTHQDGLPANEFTDRNSAKTADGRIVFGSVAGFTIINPANLVSDTSINEVIISDITFQNQSIRTPVGKQFLTTPIEETKEISLPYNRNSFTLHFFTRNKDFRKYNSYSYRMVGLEKKWTFLGKTNHINYTNLSPGSYLFEVKNFSETNIGEDNTTRLIIRIKPPWYLSWYAYVGYLVLLGSLVYLSLTMYTNRVQLKKTIEISEFKVQKEHELTEKKLAFFTNISHDLKTPLTLIDAPVNDLLNSQNLDSEQKNALILIRRNSGRLYKLITDLLDFRKLTEKKVALYVTETNIEEIIEEIFFAFKEECRTKSVKFEKRLTVQHLVYVDTGKIEKILWNLLSNAVKFTQSGEELFLGAEIIIRDDHEYLQLVVKDTGIGISEADLKRIFDPFYQVNDPKINSGKGTGIGLSIVKDLVNLHHGEIDIQSVPGEGTIFKIVLPSEKDQYSAEEFSPLVQTSMTVSETMRKAHPEAETTLSTNQDKYNLPRILVVEDNDELRNYLAGHFKKSYKVFQAEDGLEGMRIAREINVDLVLTDVQMPNMNGYEFCKELRNNFQTSHLPVIMLTANSTTDQQIEGLSTGADAYVTKPFDIQLLDTVLYSILENRKKLRYKFLGVEAIEMDENSLPQKDLDFIIELKNYIKDNLADQNLNVELLSKHFSVSRTQLNRKIKSLTGSTPNNMIKTIRLKKAFELISQKDVRVSEVAYLTGFSDPNYFTSCFKKEFGVNPSQIGENS